MVNINNSSQIHKPMFHGKICNVNTPNLIGMSKLKLPKFIGVYILGLPQLAQILFTFSNRRIIQTASSSGALVDKLSDHLLRNSCFPVRNHLGTHPKPFG